MASRAAASSQECAPSKDKSKQTDEKMYSAASLTLVKQTKYHHTKITEEKAKIIEEEAKIAESRAKIIEEEAKIAEAQAKITEEKAKIVEAQSKTIESQAIMIESHATILVFRDTQKKIDDILRHLEASSDDAVSTASHSKSFRSDCTYTGETHMRIDSGKNIDATSKCSDTSRQCHVVLHEQKQQMCSKSSTPPESVSADASYENSKNRFWDDQEQTLIVRTSPSKQHEHRLNQMFVVEQHFPVLPVLPVLTSNTTIPVHNRRSTSSTTSSRTNSAMHVNPFRSTMDSSQHTINEFAKSCNVESLPYTKVKKIDDDNIAFGCKKCETMLPAVKIIDVNNFLEKISMTKIVSDDTTITKFKPSLHSTSDMVLVTFTDVKNNTICSKHMNMRCDCGKICHSVVSVDILKKAMLHKIYDATDNSATAVGESENTVDFPLASITDPAFLPVTRSTWADMSED